jgi:hypothetical protein
MKKAFRFLVLAFASLLMTLSVILLFESYLHFTGYINKPLLIETGVEYKDKYHHHDPKLIYVSNYTSNNSISNNPQEENLQFRPDLISNSQMDENTYVILMLGDSFTYGHNVADLETYPAQLERELATKGYNINVLNAGVSGYGIDQQYVLLKRILKYIQPDLVIFNINQNDIDDSNDNCLFRKNIFGSYTQVPGSFSNIYRQSLFLKYLPLKYHDSKVINLLLYSDSLRKNFLCTEKKFENWESDILAKIHFFFSSIEKDLSDGTDILFTFVPIQSYFSPKYSNSYYNLVYRKEILDQLSDFWIFDTNARIAELFSPGIRASRDGLVFLDGNLSEDNYISDPLDLSHSIFLGDDRDPSPLFGEKHMNELGNALIGDLVSEKILNKYKLPLK